MDVEGQIQLGPRSRAVTAALIALVIAGGCAGSAPPGSSGATVSGSSPAASGAAAIDFTDTDDPSAASRRELDLVRELRDSAGMPALLGATGPAAFAALDGIEAGFGVDALSEPPLEVASVEPLSGQLAAIGSAALPPQAAPPAIDISLFADTGFTTSAILTLAIETIRNAAQTQSGTLPRDESFDQTANGLRQQVSLHSTWTIRTGGGTVSVDITMSATDRITNAATGALVGNYHSTSNGHFDVNACPDRNGVSEGTYTFTTTHELSETGAAPAGAGRAVEAPFKLINGDDAHLVRIEANLDVAADGHGPGTAGGPGPTNAFDWTATQQQAITIPARGGTTVGGGNLSASGPGAEAASGAMFYASAMAQLMLAEVGKKAEEFWRSGECIELKPSDDTRKVQPNGQIDLTVEATHKFDGQPVEAPITAAFSGTKSLEPANTPVDPPAGFTFIAGPNKDDKGTIDLLQTSKRGIGKRQVVYTVDQPPLRAAIESRLEFGGGITTYSVQIHLRPIDLAPSPDGTYRGTGTATWTTTIRADPCKPTTYDGEFETEVTARIDEADANRAYIRTTVAPGAIETVTITCEGQTFPFPGTTFLAGWIVVDQPVTIGERATINAALGSRTTVTVTRPAD